MYFIDKPTKLYYSLAWGSLVRITLGKFIRYPNGLLILPSNFIYFKCLDMDCKCYIINLNYIGRVLCVR